MKQRLNRTENFHFCLNSFFMNFHDALKRRVKVHSCGTDCENSIQSDKTIYGQVRNIQMKIIIDSTNHNRKKVEIIFF